MRFTRFGLQRWHTCRRTDACRLALNQVHSRFVAGVSSDKYDVVIVGGGIIGISCGWQLAQHGQRVVVLEQNTLTSGSTWHAAGLVTGFKGDPIISQLAYSGRALFKEIQEVEGQEIGWHETGSLAVARSDSSAMQLLYAYQNGKFLGHSHELITDFERAQELHPFIANSKGDFVLAVHSPHDGIVNPADATMAIAKRARKSGCEIRENTEAVDCVVENHRLRAVTLKSGETLECQNLICAGAVWTRGFLKNAFGECMPLGYGPHQYMISERIEGVSTKLPVVREFTHNLYCKPEVGGLMVGVFEPQPIPHIPDFVKERQLTNLVPSNVSNEVFEASVEKVENELEAALNCFPVLEATGMHQWLHGPDVHSHDHGFILGPLSDVDNVYVASGFNSQGIQCAPGIGIAMREWILNGYPKSESLGQSLASIGNHFENHNVRRCNPEIAKNDEWVYYRALESYGGTFTPHKPREQPETVRGLALKSPFYDALLEEGAVWGEAYGWERPMYFDPSLQKREPFQNEWEELSPHRSNGVTIPPEHYGWEFKNSGWFKFEQLESAHCRKECAVFDMTPFGKVSVTGIDALALLNYAVTGDVDRCNGSILYTCWCVPTTGGVNGDLTVCRIADQEFYCVLPAPDAYAFIKHLRYCGEKLGLSTNGNSGSTVKVKNATSEMATLAIMGPKSRKVFQQAYPDVAWDNDSFPFGTAQVIDAATGTRALRVSFAGELGWELHIPNESNIPMAIYKKMKSSAKEVDVALRDAGMFSLLQSLRVEKGFVHNGHDCHPDATPAECGLGFTVDWKKGDFAGKEALLAAKANGVRKRLVTFLLPNDLPDDFSACPTPHGHYSDIVYRDGQTVGQFTSVAYSHTLDQPIALGFVSLAGKPDAVKMKAFLESGHYEVDLVHRGSIIRVPVQVSLTCAVDPKGHRLQGSN
jgi:4-methylaminobutanoate oxidase (formaldehyde-forming)